MNTCARGTYSGWSDCVRMLSLMNGFELYDKGTVFTAEQAANLTYIKGLLANVTLAGRVGTAIPISKFTNTTDDITETTTELGKTFIGGKPIPKGTAFAEGSLCDYDTIKSLEGATFEFVPYFQDGTKWLTKKADGTYRGFSVRIGTKFGLTPSDVSESFPIYLMFNSYNEFENIKPLLTTFQFDDVIDECPGGLSLEPIGDYTEGVQRVKVTKRCADEFVTGLTSADNFPVIATNGTAVTAITLVSEIGQGVYDLTIKTDTSGTPTNLTSTEYCTIQAQDGIVTFADYLSNELTIKGTV